MRPSSIKPTTLIALRHGGTHLIQPLIRHMTGKSVHAPKGQDALDCIPGARLVVFLRDPRNLLVSHFRYKRSGAEPDDLAFSRFIAASKKGQTPIYHMLAWARRWARDPAAYIVRFELLMAYQLAETERLRAYLDAPGSAVAAVEYTFGKSGTWTGRHSRWTEWFGPETTRIWNAQGGRELLEQMGY